MNWTTTETVTTTQPAKPPAIVRARERIRQKEWIEGSARRREASREAEAMREAIHVAMRDASAAAMRDAAMCDVRPLVEPWWRFWK